MGNRTGVYFKEMKRHKHNYIYVHVSDGHRKNYLCSCGKSERSKNFKRKPLSDGPMCFGNYKQIKFNVQTKIF